MVEGDKEIDEEALCAMEKFSLKMHLPILVFLPLMEHITVQTLGFVFLFAKTSFFLPLEG
jgi:hypothetical protein